MNIIGGRPQGATGYTDGSSALRIKPKKSPSVERETQGTALQEENVADLIARSNADLGETVAVHDTADENAQVANSGKVPPVANIVDGSVLGVDADKGADDNPE